MGNSRFFEISILASMGGPALPSSDSHLKMDLQKLADKEACADSPCGCDLDGCSDGQSDWSCRQQA